MSLESLKVVELTRLLPAPLVGTCLRDLGATVIKVELLPRGDSLRGTDLFELLNRGKYSLAVLPEQLPEILPPLLAQADVLLTNYRPETQSEVGLSPAEVQEAFPHLVYLNLIGMADGRPGHDLNFLAEAGVLDRLRLSPDGPPVVPGFLFGDILGGTASALIHLLASLYRRNHTGKGTYLEVSMREEMLRWSYATAHLYRLFRGQLPPPGTDIFSGGLPCYRLYPTRDQRYIAVAALEEKYWEALCHFLGKPELIPYGRTLGDPYPHQVLEEVFRQHTWAEWREKLANTAFCVSPVYTFQEALQAPWAASIWRKAFLYFSSAAPDASVPQLGEHNKWAAERFSLPL